MKHSKKTLLTALMLSAAAFGAVMLLTGCTKPGYSVYGPPPVSQSDTDGIELESMTKDDFLNITDDELIALAEQFNTLPNPQYCSFLPDADTRRIKLADQSAKNTAEAFALAREFFGAVPVVESGKKRGQWWAYEAGFGMTLFYLIPDRDFFDVETQTLNAKVNEENVLKLAAMRDFPIGRKLAAFTEDEGSQIRCTEFILNRRIGEEEQSDTAIIQGRDFTVDKKSGKLDGYQDDWYMFCQEAEIPGTAQAETE